MDSKITGNDIRPIAIGGRVYEMRPLTPSMVGEMHAKARSRAIKEFFQAAKEAGMGFDLINAQLNRINSAQSVGSLITGEDLAYLLWLRVRHGGADLDEVQAIPLSEIFEHALAIQDEDEPADGEGDEKK